MDLILPVLVASLLGSLHCAGMCGPLVALAVGVSEDRSWTARVSLNVAYHGGRLLTYSLIGGVCGLLGAAVDLGATQMGLYRVAAVMAGAMMIAVGVMAVMRCSGVRLPPLPLPGMIRRAVARGQRAALALRPGPRALTVGLLTALLPCGWLYLFALVAAGTGSPVRGAVVMAAFWLGTVPILVSLGVGVQTLAGMLGRRLPLVTALVIVGLGVATIALRISSPMTVAARTVVPKSTAETVGEVESLRNTTPPCCRKHEP